MRCKSKYEFLNARSYQNYVKVDFQSDIKSDNRWADYYTTNEVNEKWDIFEKILEDQTEIHCPMKKIRVRSDSP